MARRRRSSTRGPESLKTQFGVRVGSHRIQFGKGFGDLARESRVQALGLVNSDEFLEFACGIRLNARPFRFEHRTVHLPLGPHLAVAGSCRRRSAGQDDRRTGQ
jgi:hypothetical protein